MLGWVKIGSFFSLLLIDHLLVYLGFNVELHI